MRKVLCTIIVEATAMLIILAVIFTYINYSSARIVHGPAPFPGKLITLDKFYSIVKARNLDIFIPSNLPWGYKLTGIWYMPGDIIIVFDNRGVSDYRYARIGLEISRGIIPFEQSKPHGYVVKYETPYAIIKGYIVEKAYCIYSPTGYISLAELWITSKRTGKTMFYLIGVLPPLGMDELTTIIYSLKPMDEVFKEE